MRTNLLPCLLGLGAAGGLLWAQHSAPAPADRPASALVVAQGSRVFASSCSVGYCHGLEGRAGKGPRLRDRVWSRAYLYKTVEKGIPNSSMPAWQGRLSEENIHAVVAYVLSISQEEAAPDAAGESAKVPSEEPVTSKDAALGRSLFFDPLKDQNCGTCHRVGQSGTPVGPDLHAMAKFSDADLLRQFVSQPPSAQLVRLNLRDGELVCGLKVDDAHGVMHIYDLGGMGQPVLRTIDDEAIGKEMPCSDLNVHQANSKNYTSVELQSIAAFLKTIP